MKEQTSPDQCEKKLMTNRKKCPITDYCKKAFYLSKKHILGV